jgi:hypothetical protein
VEHRPSCALTDLSEAPFAEAMGACLQAVSMSSHVIILDSHDQEKLMLLCRRVKGAATQEPIFTYDAIGSFLVARALIPILVHGRLAPRPDGRQDPELWVMLRTSRDRIFETWIRALEFCGDPTKPIDRKTGPQILLPGERLQFYFEGSWADVYDMKAMSVTSRKLSLLDDPSSSDGKPLSVRFAHCRWDWQGSLWLQNLRGRGFT